MSGWIFNNSVDIGLHNIQNGVFRKIFKSSETANETPLSKPFQHRKTSFRTEILLNIYTQVFCYLSDIFNLEYSMTFFSKSYQCYEIVIDRFIIF